MKWILPLILAFAPAPRLALSGIFSGNIGVNTPHGRANAAIMRGLVEWMASHAGELEGVDRSRALLPQFDRLSDEQIRSAFRALDPALASE